MSRGKHKLYKNMLSNERLSPLRRRNYLQPARNKALTYRYYYYLMIASCRYEQILEHLEREFFLSQAHISNLLTQEPQHSLLQQLIQSETSVRELTRLYPQFVWRFQQVDARP